MRDAETMLAIIGERGRRGLHLEDVYRRLYNPDLYLRAYGRIYRNAGAMTGGGTGETVDGMSMRKIMGIIEKLRCERYRWTPVRRTCIPKKGGRLRPLGIPSWSDKLLQEVMRSLLEAYFEPQFSDLSHGFRPGRGCHTALQSIYCSWYGVKWFIEGDIKGHFDNIDHTVLLAILREKIHDNRFLGLVEDLLGAGFLEEWTYRPTLSGTPQGGVISPLLANIYLDRLDRYVEMTLIPEHTRGDVKRRTGEYSRLSAQIRRLKVRGGDRDEIRALVHERRKVRSVDDFDPGYRRLRYIRYADDFLLGFDGPKGEAEEIREKLRGTLERELRLELSQEKTLITHAGTEPARFLGYEVSVLRTKGVRRGVHGHPALRVPSQVIEGKVARYMKVGRPAQRPELRNEDDFSIVALYGAEYRGIVQYYAYAQNRHWLHRLAWAMELSLLRTLAGKHKSTARKMNRRFGGKVIDRHGRAVKCIQAIVERGEKPPLIARFGGISLAPEPFAEIFDRPLDRDRIARRSEVLERLLADECELCGSKGRVEVHHVRKLADLRVKGRKEKSLWTRVMASRRRKTLIVCAACHDDIHAGRSLGSPPLARTPLESRVMGNYQARFGGGPTEKGRVDRHLAGGLPYSPYYRVMTGSERMPVFIEQRI
jgi:group II intron reverse transcriptase/maturase